VPVTQSTDGWPGVAQRSCRASARAGRNSATLVGGGGGGGGRFISGREQVAGEHAADRQHAGPAIRRPAVQPDICKWIADCLKKAKAGTWFPPCFPPGPRPRCPKGASAPPRRTCGDDPCGFQPARTLWVDPGGNFGAAASRSWNSPLGWGGGGGGGRGRGGGAVNCYFRHLLLALEPSNEVTSFATSFWIR